jgi:hypothetical protein
MSVAEALKKKMFHMAGLKMVNESPRRILNANPVPQTTVEEFGVRCGQAVFGPGADFSIKRAVTVEDEPGLFHQGLFEKQVAGSPAPPWDESPQASGTKDFRLGAVPGASPESFIEGEDSAGSNSIR